MKTVILEFEPWEREAFEALEGAYELAYESARLNQAKAGHFSTADTVSIFIRSSLVREVSEHFSQLKLIATRPTGFDRIDLDTCAENGIGAANVPTCGDSTVAEHVFALLLAVGHNLTEAVDRTRRGNSSLEGLDGFDLQGRTMGAIGTARGSVVDTGAMLHALSSGRLRAAGLDVLAEEPAVREEAELLRSYFRKSHNLAAVLADPIPLRMRNVIIAPHGAFKTREAVEPILTTTHDNIDCFVRGEPCNVVNDSPSNEGASS